MHMNGFSHAADLTQPLPSSTEVRKAWSVSTGPVPRWEEVPL